MFLWTSDHQQAFLPPKQALSVAPVLALPDFSKQFQLETDASEVGVRVVLMQQGHSLARHWVLELEASLHMKKILIYPHIYGSLESLLAASRIYNFYRPKELDSSVRLEIARILAT
jgi:hypothetical protein